MRRKKSQMGLQMSDWLVLVMCIHSLLWSTSPQNDTCHLPVSAGQDLAVTELDVRCRMGLPSHLLTQLGEDRSAFCSGVWPRAILSSSWAEGWKASASSCGRLHREPQHGSFLNQKGTVRRARGRKGKREREREGGRMRELIYTQRFLRL